MQMLRALVNARTVATDISTTKLRRPPQMNAEKPVLAATVVMRGI